MLFVSLFYVRHHNPDQEIPSLLSSLFVVDDDGSVVFFFGFFFFFSLLFLLVVLVLVLVAWWWCGSSIVGTNRIQLFQLLRLQLEDEDIQSVILENTLQLFTRWTFFIDYYNTKEDTLMMRWQ